MVAVPFVDSEKTVVEIGDIVKHLGSSSSASPKARSFICSFVHSFIYCVVYVVHAHAEARRGRHWVAFIAVLFL